MNISTKGRLGKLAVVTLTLAAASGALIGCSASPTPSPTASGAPTVTTIRIGSNTNVAVLPAWVADQKGYFAKHNLNVQFTQVADVGTLPPALGTSFDVVLTPSPSLISAAASGIKMVAVSGATLDTKKDPTASIVVSKSSHIKSMSQLGNTTVGALAVGGAGDVAMRAWLQKSGVNLNTVKIIGVAGPTQADQLSAGRVAAVQTGEPFRAQMLQAGNAVDLGDPYLAIAPSGASNFTAIGWAGLSSWASANPQAIDEFRAALNDGIKEIQAHPSVAVAALEKYAAETPAVAQATILPQYTTAVHPADYGVWLKAMKTVSGFTGKVNLNSLFLAEDQKKK